MFTDVHGPQFIDDSFGVQVNPCAKTGRAMFGLPTSKLPSSNRVLLGHPAQLHCFGLCGVPWFPHGFPRGASVAYVMLLCPSTA